MFAGRTRSAMAHGNDEVREIPRMSNQAQLSRRFARYWFAWNEMAFHAGITIALRSYKFAAELLMRGAVPASEWWRMIGEKQLAALEAAESIWSVPRGGGPLEHAARVLRPYRRLARANARRLSRPRRRGHRRRLKLA